MKGWRIVSLGVALAMALFCASAWATDHGGREAMDNGKAGMDHAEHAAGKADAKVMGTAHDAMGEAGAAMGQAGHKAMEQGDKAMGDAGQAMEHAGNGGMDHTQSGDMAAEGHDHEAMMAEAAAENLPVGVTEHLGEIMPPDAMFTDSEGKAVRLGDLFADTPTIVLPVYYSCPNVCHILQSSFSRILPKVTLEPGKEIQVVSISFDERDTPQTAAKSKRNFAMALRDGFPPEHWKFLVGDKGAIARAMNAMGFGFQRVDNDFAHPVVVVAVAPGGKIVRYLYGTDPLPFDVTMAATEAAQGKVGLSVKRVLAYCFSYDPEGRRYTFDLMRVAGLSILGFIAIVMAVLFMAGTKRKRRTRIPR